jgi:16S rRNA processing protein RimM
LADNLAERICVAQIGAAHGIRGEVRLWVFTEDPAAIAQYGPLEAEDGSRSFEIETIRPAKDHFVARLAGVADRNAAERLTNVKLFVPRDRLPPTEDDDTFYHADLIGLSVIDRDGAAIGTVLAVHDFGAGDILEVRPTDGGVTLMFPFTQAVVPDIDLAAKRITVIPQQEAAED